MSQEDHTEERTWEQGPDASPTRLKPVEHSIADVEAIPLGSEVILADFLKERMSTGDWDEQNRDHMLAQVRELGAVPSGVAMLYLPPLPDPGEVANNIMEREGLTSLDGLGRINLRILGELLVEAARKGGGQ